MPPSGIPPKRALPSKEAGLFKELLNHYETRQLKKGLKAADQILKKCPEHGETIAMKGLVLTHLGRREEGLELVKKGAVLDLTSHICWHVHGLIQKGEKNYEGALKSYTMALKFDKENLNILRDAAHLQTQLRHFDALVDTRHTLLRLRPNLRQNWIGLAVAYHLNGSLEEAKKVLEHYEATLKNIPDYDVEHSEVLLYHVRILEELGETQEALNLLDVESKSRSIIDRTAIMEYRARLLTKLKMDDAEHAWQALIQQNPDCYQYYQGYFSNRGVDFDNLTDETRGQALELLQDFSKQLPRAAAPPRLALDVSTGDAFKGLVEPYIWTGLHKGVPSLFADLKSLYRDPNKQQAIETCAESYLQKLSSLPITKSLDKEDEPPTTFLWTLYFLAQHFSHISQHSRSLNIISKALDHTPTLPELLTLKARVLKRLGDPYGAARAMDEARVLDLQDRFLNTKCAKYRLRAGLEEEAQEVLGLFTKKDAPSPAADLEDMQSLLFLTEDAHSHQRNGNLGMALKKFHAVQKIFNEVEDDQYDFHGYSLRRFTLNVYMDLLPWEDQSRSHPAFVTSAIAASQIYVKIHDNPSLTAVNSTSNISAEEKKAKRKAKKAGQKMKEEVKKGPPTSNNDDKGLEPPPVKDDDPDGTKLLQSPDPLDRAAKFLAPLTRLAKDNIDVWIAVYDVAIRRKKYLQAVQALTHAKALNAENPELHIRLVDLRKNVTSLPQPLPAPIEPVLSSSLTKLIPADVDLERFNSQYVQTHSTSSKAVLASAKVLHLLEHPIEEVESAVFGALNPEVHLDFQTAQDVLTFLKDIKSELEEKFRVACDAKFELSTIFKSAEEIVVLRKAAFAGVEPGEKDDECAVEEVS